MAVRDTWLSRISNYYFLSSKPYPYLPVTVIPNTQEDYLSNMNKTFYGLEIIYKHQQKKPEHQRQKWFYIIGCDTYVDVNHLLKRLDPFDYKEVYFIGGYTLSKMCWGENGTQFPVEFVAGGPGILLSYKLLEVLRSIMLPYFENVWPKDNPWSDVALSCMIKKLGYNSTIVPGFYAFTPARTFGTNGHKQVQNDFEPNNWHYVPHQQMYELDEYHVFHYIDRLVNDQNWLELTQFTRDFVASHYEVLRKKNQECELPKI
ncbi:unnamed protein product [Didymodactylos carnosus]|uniref:N-acetylgalactosaminide beta-1,3-galactosyltransferase n=1 Tax=Didymodactylos carnosus TaxID=1234261 RepID=A0A815NLF9_9BILA|nr:unnamed protein product [Didymodactylos carnosus]CAF1439860.1 unnamed protein product [Didymodactylos carnosus]CAF3619035.1 unnamed protein product [Didymodactylos carnosus]CAF4316321.1 unnamed protein product [Didymodactylos carnosus]